MDGNGDAAADEALSRFVERFASELTEAGMQRMAARVFAALFASETASMTSAELAGQLRISPAAVSGAVRYLSQVNMVGREREPGSRRDRYVLHNELWYEAIAHRDEVLVRWRKILSDGAETLGPDSAAGARAAETAEFFEFIRHELRAMLVRWREHKARGADGSGDGADSGAEPAPESGADSAVSAAPR
ncbi:MarR family transcriptional regulator [Streptomyces sp. NPDC047968]|uniref:GbsR/MarR family transcriptional regulator n=1 Tax=unclassified Streptomyces TaxID=2593676 RepID=UPI003412679E